MNKKIILLCGVSCSGKSTFASTTVRHNPDRYIVVNRDKIRELLYGYTEQSVHEYYSRNDFNKLEKQVTKYEDNIIRQGLADNKTVIVDATHLKREYLQRFKFWNVPVELEFFDVDLELAISRDSNRNRTVGKEVIERQHKKYKSLRESLKNNPIDFTPTILQQNENLPTCYIFDIDGTLARMNNRSPYDWSKVGDDEEIDEVSLVAKILDDKLNVIVCTGRDGICESDTRDWLDYWRIPFMELHIRPQGDMRPDWIVKEEMWRDISTRYYINGIFDDRQQVVDRSRSLGLKVFQVENHNF
ncbi:MAG TPA: AAA family ATPase [Candidatus Dojkabacteria bacterium]|nr:AAA family ATPase [Candidatus Dojkabacteria bacterium]